MSLRYWTKRDELYNWSHWIVAIKSKLSEHKSCHSITMQYELLDKTIVQAIP